MISFPLLYCQNIALAFFEAWTIVHKQKNTLHHRKNIEVQVVSDFVNVPKLFFSCFWNCSNELTPFLSRKK